MLFKVSIVVPIYNEEKNIEFFYLSLKKVLLRLSYPYETIFVDDGSNDKSFNLLEKIKIKDTGVKVITLDKRYGQLNAYLVGFDHASGEVVITMDADLQYEPDDLFGFLEKMHSGFDFISGYRIGRKGPPYRKIISSIANWLISAKTGIKLRDWGCGFNALKRDLIFSLKARYRQDKLYLLKPFLASLADSVGELEIHHYSRRKGHSKYSFFSIIKLGLSFLLNFSINREVVKCAKYE